MSDSLFLNKKRVDLYDVPITRKIQISEVSEVTQRKSSFSYTIKLPKTANNIGVCDMLGTIGDTSRKPFEVVVADYVVDGIHLVENGVAIIRSTSDSFEVNLIDGVKALGDLLHGKKLVDLPLSDLDHYLTTQGYIDSYDNEEGYIYCVGNFGLGVSSEIKVEEQAPSVYVHTLFRKIFESNGLNLVGDFFTTNERYLTEVLTPAKGYEVLDSALTSTAKGGANTNTLADSRTINTVFYFDEKFTFTNNALVGAFIVGGNITFSVAGTYKIEIDSSFSNYRTYVNLSFRINDVEKANISLTEGGTSQQNEIIFTVGIGDVVSLYLKGSSFYPDEDNPNYFISYNVQCDTLLYLQSGGQLIQIADSLADMNQLDFIKDVINRYGLVLRPIQKSIDYEFRRLEVILNDRENAEDWTSKVSGINSEGYISGYAKINKATYNYHEDIEIPTQDGEMLIDNENADSERSMFSSPFEITIISGSVNVTSTYLVPIWALEDSVVTNQETPPKVMRIKRVDTAINAKLFSEAVGISESTDIPFLSLDEMSMQLFLDEYYRAFNSLVDNYKSVEFLLNMSVIDIYNLDFFKLKYFRQTGRYYYLNHVRHTAGKLSKAVMNEILEFPQNLPPSQIGSFSFDMDHGATRAITYSNLTLGYADPEGDAPLKFKIISGFNTNVLLKQNGVTITAETEIDVDDLDLTAVEVLGGVSAYSESWIFAIADIGSESYGELTGTITANVLVYVNNPPVADAGSDQNIDLPDNSIPVTVNVSGSGSADDTGEIVSWFWEILTKPAFSTASMNTQNTSNPIASMNLPNNLFSIGTYELQLTVTDEFGLDDTDIMEVIVTKSV